MEESAAAPDHASLANATEPFVVVKQLVEIDVDFSTRTWSGHSTLWLYVPDKDTDEISLDARHCEIDVENITVDDNQAVAVYYSDPYDLMRVPKQWQIGATQHHVMRKRMQPLTPQPSERPDLCVRDRENTIACVPVDRSLRISIRPEDKGDSKGESKTLLKIKTSRVDGGKATEKRDLVDEPTGIRIRIPFRSKGLRDGLHFVGVEHGDKRYPHAYTRHSTEAGAASCIFPCVDDPKSRHPWTITVKCPLTLQDALRQLPDTNQAGGSRPELTQEDKMREMTILCSGILTSTKIEAGERKKVMTFECKFAAAQQLGFAIGPFEHVDLWSEFRTEESDEKLGVNAAKIHGYCLPGRADELRHTCAPIVAASDFFALEVAKYPFDSYKICFLEDMIPDTVSVNSLSMCSSRLLYPEDVLDTEIDVTRKLVHSLASQYLGVHIIPDERSGAWIVIGMQWFMTDLFMRSLCGVNWYKFHIKTLTDKLVQQDINRPSLHDMGKYLYLGDFELEFMELKAPLVLFIMDQRMMKYPGGSGICRVMSQLVSAANISDTLPEETCINAGKFMETCEKTSHYRLDKFWQQWVMSAGCPRLVIKQRFNKKNLNVEIQIQQTPVERRHAISKDEFWREYQEELHAVYAGEVPAFFTGPFTVRIHEADGTPYEHYLDIKDDDKDGLNWSIPYNTKYKRIRKSKRRDGAMAAAANQVASKADLPDEEVVYFNMLGDVLQSDQEKQCWGLSEWEKQVQDTMDQESFEWIRFDCNFEWLAHTTTDMPGYMYLAQLQQDRDVVAHQDAMLFFTRAKRHSMISTIEVRTLVDKRYFHGIRTMAASDLPKQATRDLNYWGLAHLVLAFRHFFCYEMAGRNGVESWPLAANDFRDKAQYAVQCAIPLAIARTRENNRCPAKARSFLWDLIQFNDNESNEYSDHMYMGKLLEALTTSVITEDVVDRGGSLMERLNPDDEDDGEFKLFIGKTCETIERFRRMDEWTNTYHNVWTTTAMDCKMRLMKAKIIPLAPLEFLQYCQDENLDLVRIKAWECLIELGMIGKPQLLKLFLHTMSTDASPFVRHQLFKALCRGIAAIGLGEHKVPEPEAAKPEAAAAGDPMDMDDEDDNGGLVVEAGDVEIQQRKLDAKRKEDIATALAALKEELKGNVDLQIGIWKALQSPSLGLKETQNLLELCAAMFDKEDSLQVTFSYPKVWACTRKATEKGPNGKKRCILTFSSTYRTTPKNPGPMLPPPPPVVSQVSDDRPAERPKIKLSNKSSVGGASAGASGVTAGSAQARPRSISISSTRATPAPATPAAVLASAPAAVGDSIAVLPAARVPTPSLASSAAPSPSGRKPNGHAVEKKAKAKKRPSEAAANGTEPPPKKAKSNDAGRQNAPRQRLVTVKFTAWDKLPPHMRVASEAHRGTEGGAASSIVATPTSAARVSFVLPKDESPTSTPGSGSSVPPASAKQRKPLPSSAPAVNASPTPAVNGVAATATGDALGSAPPRKMLKIKLKTQKPVT